MTLVSVLNSEMPLSIEEGNMMGQVMSPSATCINLPSTYLNFILLFLHSSIRACTRVVVYIPLRFMHFGLCSLLQACDVNVSCKNYGVLGFSFC